MPNLLLYIIIFTCAVLLICAVAAAVYVLRRMVKGECCESCSACPSRKTCDIKDKK